MSPARRGGGGRGRAGLLLLGLVAAHFYLRPRVWDGRAAPDLLMLALLLFAIRSRPGLAAVAGFVTGFFVDALSPARLGAGALAHTLVGYVAASGRAVFFPDNLLVNAGLFFGGVWLRDAIMLVASGTSWAELLSALGVWAPLQALTTAMAGFAVVLVFRDWFSVRPEP